MQIWIDADACPVVVKEILYRASERRKIPLTLVANRAMRIPESPLISLVVVGEGMDVADREIVERLAPGDLVVTADIPLAADTLTKGGVALNPRGELYTEETISEKLRFRDLFDTLRGAGIETAGPAPFSKGDRQAFANQLDRLLTRNAGN